MCRGINASGISVSGDQCIGDQCVGEVLQRGDNEGTVTDFGNIKVIWFRSKKDEFS